jgi:hypothetical protein
VLEAVRKLGLEGVIGKRIDSTCEPGERSASGSSTGRIGRGIVIGGYVAGALGFDACSWASTKTRSLIFVAKGSRNVRLSATGGELPGPKSGIKGPTLFPSALDVNFKGMRPASPYVASSAIYRRSNSPVTDRIANPETEKG